MTEASTETQKEAILPAAVAGELKLAFAWVEARSGFDLFDVRTTAARRDGGWVVDGAKGVVLGAAAADRLIVSARTSGGPRDRNGIGLFLVDREADGVTVRGLPHRGRTASGGRSRSRTSWSATTRCWATRGTPCRRSRRWAERAIAALCAEAVGG